MIKIHVDMDKCQHYGRQTEDDHPLKAENCSERSTHRAFPRPGSARTSRLLLVFFLWMSFLFLLFNLLFK